MIIASYRFFCLDPDYTSGDDPGDDEDDCNIRNKICYRTHYRPDLAFLYNITRCTFCEGVITVVLHSNCRACRYKAIKNMFHEGAINGSVVLPLLRVDVAIVISSYWGRERKRLKG